MVGIAYAVHAGCAARKRGGTGPGKVHPKLPGHLDCGLQTSQAFRRGRPLQLQQFADVALLLLQAALAGKLAVPSALLQFPKTL